MFICKQKINFILHVFFEILQRYCKFVVLCALGMSCYKDTKRFYQLPKNFRVYLQVKSQLHPPRFSGDTAKILKLLILGAFGVPSHEHPNIDAISLYKTSMYNCMPKINLLIHFFLGILHFKESCNLISP